MSYPEKLNTPEIQAKRKQLAQIRYPISVKAIQWAEANGYSGLIREVDRFMSAYRLAMEVIRKANVTGYGDRARQYYERQSPEQLSKLLQKSQAQADRVADVLKDKVKA